MIERACFDFDLPIPKKKYNLTHSFAAGVDNTRASGLMNL